MTQEQTKEHLRRGLGNRLPMDKDVKERWVAALRSGKYEQGSGYLRRDKPDGCSYCCLGVLLEEERDAALEHVHSLSQSDECGLPSDASARILRIGVGSMGALSDANDSGLLSFGDIADAIEECL